MYATVSEIADPAAYSAGSFFEPGQQPRCGDPADRAAGGGDQDGMDAVGDHRALDLEERGVLGERHDAGAHERAHRRVQPAACPGAAAA